MNLLRSPDKKRGTNVVATTRDLKNDIDEIMPGVVADRRHLHQHPELGFQEFETAKLVAERLESMGVEDIRTGIAVTGVTGLIKGTKAGGPDTVVLVRADMDALPILEENNVDYRSQTDGKMHACGHDAHTSMLLGVGRLLLDRRDEFSGTVKLLFQPAEEGGGGARVMIEEGVLEDPAVDLVFGQHVAAEVPVGRIELRGGPCMAAADRFDILIKGKGGHGAQPHLTVDSIAVGAQIVTALHADARMPNSALAELVGIAASTCHGRVRRLQELGVIRGFHADIDPAAIGLGLQAMISVSLQSGARARIRDFIAHMRRLPQVMDVYFLAGADDFILHVAARDTAHLRAFVVENLNADADVAGTQTSLIFEHLRGASPL